jgi:hypothetical protein
MDFSQPYGTPPVPIVMPPGTRSYSRYVNGNPVTGTEGSIPPATAFDEAQVEIVEVIQRAGIVPTHGDLTQLWQALMALFAQKYITSPITKTVHGVGADFTDLNAAMTWVAQYIITATGFVTFMVAAGKWTYTQTVEINHANSNRIAIQGGALLGAAPTGPNMTVTGYKVASDGTAQITYLRSIFATELSFTGGVTGFHVSRGGATMRYLLLTGSQTIATGYRQGIGLDVFADLMTDGLAFWGWGYCAVGINEAGVRNISSLSFTVSYCASGFVMRVGWYQAGEFTTYPDQIQTETIITSCGMGSGGGNRTGIDSYAGSFWAGKLTLKGCSTQSGNGAINCETGSQFICAHGSVISINAPQGLNAVQSTVIFEYSSLTSNSQYGAFTQGGIVFLDYSNCAGNGSYDLIAGSSGYIEIAGGSANNTSPARNTWGGDTSYIYG